MKCLNCDKDLKWIMSHTDQVIIIHDTTIMRFVSCDCGHDNQINYGRPIVVESYDRDDRDN